MHFGLKSEEQIGNQCLGGLDDTGVDVMAETVTKRVRREGGVSEVFAVLEIGLVSQ